MLGTSLSWAQTNLSSFVLQGIDHHSVVKLHDPTTHFLYMTQIKELRWTFWYNVQKVEVTSTCTSCLHDQGNHMGTWEGQSEAQLGHKATQSFYGFHLIFQVVNLYNVPREGRRSACLIQAPAQLSLLRSGLWQAGEDSTTSLGLQYHQFLSSLLLALLRKCQSPSTRSQREGGGAPGWLGGCKSEAGAWAGLRSPRGGDGETLEYSQGTAKEDAAGGWLRRGRGADWGQGDKCWVLYRSSWRKKPVTLTKKCPASCSVCLALLLGQGLLIQSKLSSSCLSGTELTGMHPHT